MIHPAYQPEQLLGTLNDVERKNAPKVLYAAGDIGLLRTGPRVSVIGSRKASTLGISRTGKLVRALTARRMVIVSGLAEGIDTHAHRTAIESGGRTIGVIGTPLNKYFPAANRSLQEHMMEHHLVVSQFSDGGGSKNFPMRNRTMALLSDASVIVEAGANSGTVHQGWEALRLGRPLFLLESLADLRFEWTEKLRHYGAQVLSDENFENFLSSVPERTHDDQLAF